MFRGRVAGSRFVRNVAIVATGTAGAQAIAVAFAPLITRIYSPEAFGVLGAFIAMLGIAKPLAALSYPIAIVLPKDDSDAVGIARLSLLIGTGMFTATTLLLLVLHQPILVLLNLEVLGSFIFLLPAAMFFLAGTAVMEKWVIRKKLFTIKAKIAVAHSLLVNGAKTVFGLANPVAATLIVMHVTGTLLHALMLLVSVRRVERSLSQQRAQPKPLRELAVTYRDFPLYRTPQLVVNAASLGLPVLILGAFFGPAFAGFYALAASVLNLPLQMVGQSVADVFYPRINEAVIDRASASKLLAKATVALVIIGLLPFATLIAFGPQLFTFVFGAEWVVAGEYARWLALMLFTSFINRPCAAAIPVLGLERAILVFETLVAASRVGALVIGGLWLESDIAAVALFSLAGLLANVLFILMVFRVARALDRKQRKL